MKKLFRFLFPIQRGRTTARQVWDYITIHTKSDEGVERLITDILRISTSRKWNDANRIYFYANRDIDMNYLLDFIKEYEDINENNIEIVNSQFIKYDNLPIDKYNLSRHHIKVAINPTRDFPNSDLCNLSNEILMYFK